MAPKRAATRAAATKATKPAAKDVKATKATKSTKATATKAKETKNTKEKETTTSTTKSRATRKRSAPADEEPEAPAAKPAKRAKTTAAPKKEAKEPAAKRAKAVPKSRVPAAKAPAKKVPAKRAASPTPAAAARATKPRAATPVPPQPVAINKIPTTRFEVWSFGEGTVGELGVGPEKNILKTPRPITALDVNSVGVVQVAPGGMHIAALTHDGKIYTWGQNDNAALGRETVWEGGKEKDMDANEEEDSDDELNLNPKEATPSAIPDGFFPAGTNIVQVTAGDCATFALTDTGLVYGWGIFRNENGSWGFYKKADKIAKKEPVLFTELKNIVQVSAGENFCLALAQDGTVYSWGDGAQGQLGRQLQPRSSRLQAHAPSLEEASLTPSPLPFPKRKIVSIHAASNHAFAIDKTGNVWTWGLNNYSQTGIVDNAGESEAIIDLPRRVDSVKGMKVKLVQGGTQHSIALTEDGKCLTWGRMDGSQIGVDFKNLPVDDPEQIMKDDRGKPRIMLKPATVDIKDCVWVAAGLDHSIAVAADGKAYAWGFNSGFKCGVPDDSIDDVVEPHRIENKLMKEKKIVWAGAGGQYSLVGIEPEGKIEEEGEKQEQPAQQEQPQAEEKKDEAQPNGTEEKKEGEEENKEGEEENKDGEEKKDGEEENKDGEEAAAPSS